MKTRTIAAGTVAALTCSGVAAIMAAAPAAAICDAPRTTYSFTSVSGVWKATNLSSSYITGPGSVSLAKGRTWGVSASMTATVSAEAGIVFAKASTSLGITVGASYSGTQSFTYTLNVASGKTQRMQQYKSARKFTVTKKTLQYPCSYVTTYSSSVTAPVASNADQYFKYALVY